MPQKAEAKYRIDLRYAGQHFYGWQRLTDQPTVQAALEAALEKCFDVFTNAEGAGRTDRGTHAWGQVATVH